MKKKLQDQKSVDFHEFMYLYQGRECKPRAPPHPPTAVKKDGFLACFRMFRSFAKYLFL
jgi:hypothetical protein